jgi:hypothetical protein
MGHLYRSPKEEKMTRHLLVRPLIVVGLITLGAGLWPQSPAWAGDGPEATLEKVSVYDWTYATVDTTRDVGMDMAVALAPHSGEPYVSYYDWTAGDLWFARRVGSGGNCGPANSWSCQLVDNSNDVGRYNSIVVYSDAGGLKVAISYHDATTGSLKVATGVCGATCTFETWLIDGGYPPGGSYTGLYTSVVYSPWAGGIVNVAYQEVQDSGGESLRYAQTVDSGGNCGAGGAAGLWNCWTILSGEGLGSFNWLTLDSSLMPHLSYYDASIGYPYHLWFGASGWSFSSAQISNHDTGASVSHFTEADGHPHLAYLDATTGELVYATYVVAGGNCGFNSTTGQHEYQCDVIDGVGFVGSKRTAAMAADPTGAPIIAYRDAPDGWYSSLMLAQPYYAAPPGSVPNCGPNPGLFYTWVCTTVDAGSDHLDEAGAVSIASNDNGTAIAYHQDDDYYLRGYLKVMYRFVPLFGDGFESGDTDQWSSTVP